MSMEPNRLREQFIGEVRDATDFESVAASYGHIIKQGELTLTRCPCHGDHTPSLSIEHQRQVGRCWLCLAEGDVFWLVMWWEDVCFRDAVHKLARQSGIEQPLGASWTTSQLRRPHDVTEPDSLRSSLSLRSFQSPRKLRA